MRFLFTILTMPNCVWCDKAKSLIEARGGEYVSHSYTDHEMFPYLLSVANLKTVPQIWHGRKHIGGYEDLVKYFEETDTQ